MPGSHATALPARGALSEKAIATTKTIRAMKRSDIGGSSHPTGELPSRRRHYRAQEAKGKAGLSLYLAGRRTTNRT